MNGALPNLGGSSVPRVAELPTVSAAKEAAAPADQFPVQKESASDSTNSALVPGANNQGIQHSSVSVSLDGESPDTRSLKAHKTVNPTCDGRPVPTATGGGNSNPLFVAAKAMLVQKALALVKHPRRSEFQRRLESLDLYELQQFFTAQLAYSDKSFSAVGS